MTDGVSAASDQVIARWAALECASAPFASCPLRLEAPLLLIFLILLTPVPASPLASLPLR